MGHWIDGMWYQDHEVTVDLAGTVKPLQAKGFGTPPVAGTAQPRAADKQIDPVTDTTEGLRPVTPAHTYETKIIEPAKPGGPQIQTKEAAGGGSAADSQPASTPPAKK